MFIAQQIQNGRYGSASEVVRAGLRLLEDTENKLGALHRMLAEGEGEGEGGDVEPQLSGQTSTGEPAHVRS